MIYCDTSLLVSAMTKEGASVASRIWLGRHLHDGLAISGWVQTGVAGAIAIKVRRGDLDEAYRLRVLRAWTAVRPSIAPLGAGPRHFERAADLLLETGARLRSGDALHLAIALDHGCALATLDVDLHEAAARHGIASDPTAALS